MLRIRDIPMNAGKMSRRILIFQRKSHLMINNLHTILPTSPNVNIINTETYPNDP